MFVSLQLNNEPGLTEANRTCRTEPQSVGANRTKWLPVGPSATRAVAADFRSDQVGTRVRTQVQVRTRVIRNKSDSELKSTSVLESSELSLNEV